MNRIPRIQDPQHELSGHCHKPKGLKQLDRIPRTLPPQVFDNEDMDILQDEDGAAVLDEVTANYIYDTFKNSPGRFE